MQKQIKVNQDRRKSMIESIKSYFLEERDLDLGDLAASLVLDFFLAELAPAVYNQGVDDAYVLMTDRIEDLHSLEIVKR